MNMQVSNLSQTNYSQISSPHFTSNLKDVYSKTGKFLYKTSTSFFRPDLDWNVFTNMLIRKYKNTEKVGIHCTACSEGAEPFSLAMLLIEKLGEKKAQKFFPIIASDINAEILQNPKNGIIKVSDEDIRYIKQALGDNYSKYIEFSKKSKYSKEAKCWLYEGQIKPILKDKVIFKNMSARRALSKIEKGDNIFICRNFWSYNPDKEQSKLADEIFAKLDENSLCVIGEDDDDISKVGHLPKMRASQFTDDFSGEFRLNSMFIASPTDDVMSKATHHLKAAGFRMSRIPYCFIKPAATTKHLVDPKFLMATFANRN